jgi:hypothetical protein
MKFQINFNDLLPPLPKFSSIGKEIAHIIIRELNTAGEREMKNFDQWTEELSKKIFFQTEKDETRILSRLNEMVDEDYEEE